MMSNESGADASLYWRVVQPGLLAKIKESGLTKAIVLDKA